MKRDYLNVEIITEYAKEVTWEDRQYVLGEQDWIVANQNKRQRRLMGKVDYLVTDSPILMSASYIPENYYISCMKQHIIDIHESYNSINFFLRRKKRYVPIGRSQTEKQALEKDAAIIELLNEQNVEFDEVLADNECPATMLTIIKTKLNRDIG